MFSFFLSFALGIILGWVYTIKVSLAISLSIISLVLVYSFRKINYQIVFNFLLIIFFISLGAIWILPYTFSKPYLSSDKKREFILKVTSFPKQQSLRKIFYARILKIDNLPANFNVRVNDYSNSDVEYLNIYRVCGKLKNYRVNNASYYILWLKNNSYREKLGSNRIDKNLSIINRQLLKFFRQILLDEAYRFIASIFLGRKEFIEKEEKNLFMKAGISHLLAISGLHIGLVSVFLFFILKIMGLKFRVRLVISTLLLFLYTLIIGSPPSTLRATIMYSTFVLSFLLKRKINLINSLGLSGLISLFFNPLWIFDIGFQLSFMSVLGMILGFENFNLNLPLSNLILTYIKNIILSTIFVTVAIIPITSFYFGRVYILSIFTNLILIPFFTFVLITTFLILIFSFSPFLLEIIAEVVDFSVFLFMKISGLIGTFKLSFISFSMSPIGIFIYYLALGGVILSKRVWDRRLSKVKL
ncbi:MAG: ComEC/Rec2 family competence protein [Candidatus Omnitrophica bacterium]|nr:ComEC/Rec2 family competence protein [Candidatus Omnitrophota bacterium]